MELVHDGPGHDDPRYRLSEIIAALSHALDMTEGQPLGHATRTCLVGMRVAEVLQLEREACSALFYALLLKDAGCSSSSARMCQLFGTDDIALKTAGKTVDWNRPSEALRYAARHVAGDTRLARARNLLRVTAQLAAEGKAIVETRCDRGARIVAMLEFPPAASDAVRALDEHWDGKGQPSGLAGDAIPLLARIACLAQTAEVFFTTYGLEAAREMVRGRRGRWFDPEVADAFLALGVDDPLWERIREDRLGDGVARIEPSDRTLVADEARLDRVAEAFAQMIDAKSPFTARHSEGVAAYAVGVGEVLGYSPLVLRDLRRCGLLHDIGKLGVSNAILDKPGKLTDEEFARVREHPAMTESILIRVPAFAPLAADAASHHERLDGRGYHRGLHGSEVRPFARVLAVADVFEALTAERPYRAAVPVDEVLEMMRRDVGTAFCGEAFEALETYVRRSGAQPLAA